MSNMISVASGFQYSVNIGYDLNNDDKLKEYLFQECLFDESYDSVANIADLVNHTICGAKEL